MGSNDSPVGGDGHFDPQPDSVRFAVHCQCGDTFYPHKGGNYSSRHSEGPKCPYCNTDWRDLEGAEEYADKNGNPDWERDDWRGNTLPNGVHQGDPDDYDYPEDYHGSA